MVRPPHPALRATFSREGRRKKEETALSSPSPLAGEGGSRRLRETDEGAAVKFARHLRKNMTDAEKALWSALRDRRFDKFKFRRQVPVGKYIADFLCPQKALIVEVDGETHDSDVDRPRDLALQHLGFRVLHVTNGDVMRNMDGVLTAILETANSASARWERPHPNPSPEGEGLEKSGVRHPPC